MTNKYDDGGPAYPFHNLEVHGNPGMSLRDAFAMAAMQGAMANCDVKETAMSRAEWAYEIADAMLRARSQGEQE